MSWRVYEITMYQHEITQRSPLGVPPSVLIPLAKGDIVCGIESTERTTMKRTYRRALSNVDVR